MTDNEIQSRDCSLFVVIIMTAILAVMTSYLHFKLRDRVIALEAAATAKESK